MKTKTKVEKKPQVVEIHIYVHHQSNLGGGGSGTVPTPPRCTCLDNYMGTGTRPPCPSHPNGFYGNNITLC